jgi:hypothetical protein
MGWQGAVELHNFTAHPVTVDVSATGDGEGSATVGGSSPCPARVTLLPEGVVARVDDRRDRLVEESLRVGQTQAVVTRIRRGRLLIDLPRPVPGRMLLVSRLTALAAMGRRDLVFPLDEVREGGALVSSRGLGAYVPAGPAGWVEGLRARWRRVRDDARTRRGQRAMSRVWVTGVIFALATAFLGAALGLLPDAVDAWRGSGDHTRWWGPAVASMAVIGAGCLAGGGWRWRRLQQLREARGTAYVIAEERISWHHEERSWVLDQIGSNFAAVLRVPGPGELGRYWRWETDPERSRCWDERVEELVRSFWAVHYNDDQVTHNAVFVWAPWPVAMAFGMRATALRRGLILRVRQRPSFGAAGTSLGLTIEGKAHTYLDGEDVTALPQVAPDFEVQKPSYDVELILDPGPVASSSMTVEEARAATEAPVAAAPAEAPAILVLVVRLVPKGIGGFPDGRPPSSPVRIVVPDSQSTRFPVGRRTAALREWSMRPRAGTTSAGQGRLPWPAFPTVAMAVTDWVLEQVKAHPNHMVLLAARMPQELAVGLGIRAGQLGRQWPPGIRPLVYHPVLDARGVMLQHLLVAPQLELGAAAVPVERVTR